MGTVQAHALQVNEAYEAHRSIYSTQNPPPAKPAPPGRRPLSEKLSDLIIPAMLFVILSASVVVSGSHTIPVFSQWFDESIAVVVGIAAFLMIEGSLISLPYIRTRRNFSAERKAAILKWLMVGLLVAFGISVVANVASVSEAENIPLGETVSGIMSLAIAISAPLMAFVVGDLLAMEVMALSQAGKRRMEEYKAELAQHEARMADWQAGMNEAWKTASKNLGVRSRVTVTRPTLPDNERPQLVSGKVSGRTKTGQDNRTRVSGYLSELSESGQSRPSIRTIADALGMGKSTVADILKEMDRVSLSGNNQP